MQFSENIASVLEILDPPLRSRWKLSAGGGVCLSACWEPPRCGPGDPPGCGPGDPPGQTPSTSPWVWAWRPPQARPPQLPLGCGPEDLQGMLGYHPLDTCKACRDTTCNACWEITHLPPPPAPLWTEFLTHTSENITLPQTSFAGGNNRLAPAASVLEILDPPLQSRCFYLD